MLLKVSVRDEVGRQARPGFFAKNCHGSWGGAPATPGKRAGRAQWFNNLLVSLWFFVIAGLG